MTNKMRGWPSTAAVFAPGGKPLRTGERLVQPALARTFERLVEVERAASGRGREGALNACLDYYYRGPIAQEIVDFIQDNGGFLTLRDMAEFKLDAEPSMVGHFGRFDVVTGGPWSQAPILIQALQMLSDDDLELSGHNSADYIHTVAEVLNLAFSDRDAFYGDPDFVDVPIEGLLSAAYAQTRRTEVDPTRASTSMPGAGDPWPFEGR
ncbi:MAG: gamma-glutamyltransferase, partial [Proteobacteria bacterium]|nr:gamma-glutamyltransferase [Pseudomonadota bacterium]